MEEQVRVLLAGKDQELSAKLSGLLTVKGLDARICKSDGFYILNSVEQFRPHIVIIDVFMPEMDGISIMKEIYAENIQPEPVFILTSCAVNPVLAKSLINAGAAYYFTEPFNAKLIADHIYTLSKALDGISLLQEKKPSYRGMDETEAEISEVLRRMGVPANVKGYGYLRAAIAIVMEKPEIINSMIQTLYPAVAKKFDSTPSRVERSMRHAIEICWDRKNIRTIKEIFYLNDVDVFKRPSNSEFIATLADNLKMKKIKELNIH